MRIRNVAMAIVATLGMAQFASATQIVSAVGVFDPVFNGPVNGLANPSVTTFVSNDGTLASISAWQTRINNAYLAGLGGVWNGSSQSTDDSVYMAKATDTVWQLQTVAPGKTFSVTAANMAVYGTTGAGSLTSATAISGYHLVSANTNTALSPWSMSFSLSGFDASAKITELGFANVGRSGNVGTAASFTVTYDDLTTQTTGSITPLGQGSARLVHFLAPEGKSITKLEVAAIDGVRGIQLDDIGVIVSVPEPATAALLGVALMGLAVRRRKA